MKNKNIYNLNDLQLEYNLELDKIINEIKKIDKKNKLILLQFPEGLKPYSDSVVDFLKQKTNAEFLIWFGSCYGACDTPTSLEKLNPKVDLIIQFGHSQMIPEKF